MSEKACKRCRLITTGSICPECKTATLTAEWTGFVVVLDPGGSEIAKKLGIRKPGKYAIEIR